MMHLFASWGQLKAKSEHHVYAGQQLEDCDEQIINNYIGGSFRKMRDFGPTVYRPFMQVLL